MAARQPARRSLVRAGRAVGARLPASRPASNSATPRAAGRLPEAGRANTSTLHEKLEATLPTLPKQTHPEKSTRTSARWNADRGRAQGAKQGDIFTPAMQRLLPPAARPASSAGPTARAIDGRSWTRIRGTDPASRVNSRYPDGVPRCDHAAAGAGGAAEAAARSSSTASSANDLILLDLHAATVVDFIDDALSTVAV